MNKRTKSLFPEIAPFAEGMLERDGGHRIYWQQAGNPDGTPVVYLHGGPGAGCAPFHRRFFDPRFYRVVLLDQRGCGRSTPYGSIEANSTVHLIADLEALREHLGIAKWLVFGGSWGATLALAYGIDFPDRCSGFILRGVFLGRPEEGDWFLNGMGRFFPEARQAFAAAIPEAEHGDLLAAYHRRLTDPDPEIHLPAARAWMTYEASCSTLTPPGFAPNSASGGNGRMALSLARISAHYFINGFFLEDRPILKNLAPIRHLPADIVQGRYDMVCPPVTAEALAQGWPGSRLTLVPDAGHSVLEPGIRAGLIAATEAFKALRP